MPSRRFPRVWILLLAGLVALAVAAAAHAETGPPAPDPDGVWRVRGNWTVDAGDNLAYHDVVIEVAGTLRLAYGGTLTLSNVTLAFPEAAGIAERTTVDRGAQLVLNNVTGRWNGTLDYVDVLGGFNTTGCALTFAATPSAGASLRVVRGAVHMMDSTFVTDAAVAVDANQSEFRTLDSDFLRTNATGADLRMAGAGTYVLDTTRFGALLGVSNAPVTLYSTVRFMLRTSSGALSAGLVNGSAPGGELFRTEADDSGTSRAVRLLWLDLAPAPARLEPAERVANGPVRFTAVGATGGNTSQFPINAHRVNVTVVLDRVYDLAVILFVLDGRTPEGPPLNQAYYVDLNSSVTVHVRVRNDGAGASPPVNLTVIQYVGDPSPSGGGQTRAGPRLAVPSLAKGEAADLSYSAQADSFGVKGERRTACFLSLSYRSSFRVAIDDPAQGDFGPWNDAREFSMVAFLVNGNETAPCGTKGAIPIEWIMGGGIAAVAAVGALTYLASTKREERRAAQRERDTTAPPDGAPPIDPPKP